MREKEKVREERVKGEQGRGREQRWDSYREISAILGLGIEGGNESEWFERIKKELKIMIERYK